MLPSSLTYSALTVRSISSPELPVPTSSRAILNPCARRWISSLLYTWAGALVALLVIPIALVVANTRTLKVSWVLGSTRQSLVWIILATPILGWLLGIMTSVISDSERGGRTRRPDV